jgi:hypothetical protein
MKVNHEPDNQSERPNTKTLRDSFTLAFSDETPLSVDWGEAIIYCSISQLVIDGWTQEAEDLLSLSLLLLGF